MTTNDEFLFSHDKHQTFTNCVSHTDKSNQFSNLNLNQNQNHPILIPVQYSNNSKIDKYCVLLGTATTFKSLDSKVSDKYDKREKSEAWNKSVDLSLHTLTLGDKDEEEAKKKWKRDDLTDAKNSALSLHISAYENSKEITGLDSLDCENVELKKNKINMDKQDFLRLMIQNPFEFPRQQRKNRARKPEVMGFKASQRLLISPSRPPVPKDCKILFSPLPFSITNEIKLQRKQEKNLEADQKLKAIQALASSVKSCDLIVSKQRKERMCAETHTKEILTAQALLKTQKNENDELKYKNKINEERIAILEEQLKKAESVGHKRVSFC
uniref:Uncharacterized protein n=1 Tax=Panagrolaimus davidi TaxID=227884 RepID=A0A914Q5W6_9BILA